MNEDRCYIAIDLKSFYASVECVERGLDPLDTCLVVADMSRTEKTICLAVSPALKAYGTGGRPRLFEVVEKVGIANRFRGKAGKSWSKKILDTHPEMAIDYIVAPPRMGRYISYSTRIFSIYLRFVARDDIHVYSIDEVFIDATSYIKLYHVSPHDLAMNMIHEVLDETGITATVGIGSNLYLCKIAMDIVAKKMAPDKDGVRIASLDESSYRRQLWDHEPLTDFWRVGRGIANRLLPYGIRTMGDIAMCSIDNENLLYDLLGINAELLIDHAWGWEPVTMDKVKAYRPVTKSLSSGQVLQSPYPFEHARNIVLEMADNISLDLIAQRLVTDQLVLTIGYDVESLRNPLIASRYFGRVASDHYGRRVPIHAHGTVNLERHTSSGCILTEKVAELFDRIANPELLVRRITISVNRLIPENDSRRKSLVIQPDIFTDYEALKRDAQREKEEMDKERTRQETVLKLKQRFGKNVILKGLNFAEGATQRKRNKLIGGHNE